MHRGQLRPQGPLYTSLQLFPRDGDPTIWSRRFNHMPRTIHLFAQVCEAVCVGPSIAERADTSRHVCPHTQRKRKKKQAKRKTVCRSHFTTASSPNYKYRACIQPTSRMNRKPAVLTSFTSPINFRMNPDETSTPSNATAGRFSLTSKLKPSSDINQLHFLRTETRLVFLPDCTV